MRWVLNCAIAIVLAATGLVAGPAVAQGTYPNRTITIVVGFPAGGTTDIIARLVGQKISEYTGTNVIIENIGGGSSIPATLKVAQAVPDGYTIGQGVVPGMAILRSLVPNFPYDPEKDFVAIGLAVHTPWALVLNPAVPAKSVKEYVDLIRARRCTIAELLESGVAPERTVVCVSGDASVLMCIQELSTAMQHRAPVKLILCNNGYMGMVRQWQ